MGRGIPGDASGLFAKTSLLFDTGYRISETCATKSITINATQPKANAVAQAVTSQVSCFRSDYGNHPTAFGGINDCGPP
jgi:hypothetical protein